VLGGFASFLHCIFANLPIETSRCTSLLIIFINSASVLGDLYIGTPIDYSFFLLMISSIFIGMIIGIKLSKNRWN
jgi:uncharacterized membrane protein YfcA